MQLLKQWMGGGSGQVNAAEVKARLDGETPPFILDVRQPGEFQDGHIPGATLIPLDALGARINEIPRDRQIVCVCRSGARSGHAARQLHALGYNAVNLQGGMMAWQFAGFRMNHEKSGRR